MDFLRSCYSTTMRFPGVGDVPIRWYFTERPFLDKWTRYNSRNWLSEGVRDDSAAGEVAGAKRVYDKGREPAGECDEPKGSAAAWRGGAGPVFQCHPVPMASGGMRLGGKGVAHQADEWTGSGGAVAGGLGGFGTGWTGSGGAVAGGLGAFGTGWTGSGGAVAGGLGAFEWSWVGDGGVVAGGEGTFATGGDDVPTGAIYWYPGAAAPVDHLICDGSAVSRTTFPALFAACGTAFGAGDGSTTFNLPNLKSRSALGAGQGAGLSNRALAAVGGVETHQLVTAELPTHSHSVTSLIQNNGPGPNPAGDSLTLSLKNGLTTGTAGSGTAHANMHPYLVLTPIIHI